MQSTEKNIKAEPPTSEFRVPRSAPTGGGREKRHFMRHPVTVAIVCRCLGHSSDEPSILQDASLGGLSFISESLFAGGDLLSVSFPARLTTAQFSGVVVWRRDFFGESAAAHAYGVRFSAPEMLPRVRLLEQVCHIEAYMKIQAAQHSRQLSPNQAATEWIGRYASRFPA